MRHLPAELRDNVLDNLREDKGSLVACAVVCRAWLPRALYNLFYSVKLDWQEDNERMWLFVEALEGHNNLVRELTILDWSMSVGIPGAEELVDLIESLPRLEELSIGNPHGADPEELSWIMCYIGNSPKLAERMLCAIANMVELRRLVFGPGLQLHVESLHSLPDLRLEARGLTKLQYVSGDMFAADNMRRFWAALAAQKAEGDAMPLLHFCASLLREEVTLRALARFLNSRAASSLQSLQLDTCYMFPSHGDTATSTSP